ncbi:CPBP family intramembrane glutamic endopeptidase [Bradyrhizobium japonicum]|jgi:membrane protease YdiL (CAAX protease family)|uniref:CPBP family intramembrane glutamic endopeptidase n=1 Tax=Bradyrhizobium japonicum TaxID=375 RepID=UPI0020A10745|nr:CPBP family intramembrane glutamic endopeptidase [Bradyrhizobium japonicum]MCP1765314.1 membrane protease YdiL (CAAX protease family) [Bradyrhizobium japonicum]MCP1787452.1 membrane protease YdiL (CAAX protease family) [Bradyrhizobium japonicum]MCP1809328.1 membrane protease YdiL (CAAX protease family) [Bradyrhizobium japonicum]MCP1818261.1 membrane protease YdiL (CAAX protease family) [Bradyrhizobium japonicum]MCP1870229.1 membrane protease YdiL (CAAX protease family) [Bradyrhizobium japon
MSELENVHPFGADPSPQPRAFDFFETLLVALIVYAVFLFAAQLTIMLSLPAFMNGLSPEQVDVLWKQQHRQGAAVLLATPAAVAVLWVAIRRTGREFTEYLALNWPSRDGIVSVIGVMTIFLTVEVFVTIKLGLTRPQTNSDFVVGGATGLILFAVVICLAAPVLEEFVFRGFMFRGWSQSFLGPIGAIVITSALWAMLHTQYGWYERSWIFIMGLVLGYFRLRSNSTWLTVVAHSAMNMEILFLGGPYL